MAKRILAVLLAALLYVGLLSACGDKGPDLTGSWSVKSLSTSRETLSMDDYLPDLGLGHDTKLTLTDDDTLYATSSDLNFIGEWDLDTKDLILTVTSDETNRTYVFDYDEEEDLLTISADGLTMVFQRDEEAE